MVLNIIPAMLAFLGLALMVWQFVVAMRFPLHQRVADPDWAPPVTVLKPLRAWMPRQGTVWKAGSIKTTPARWKHSSASRLL